MSTRLRPSMWRRTVFAGVFCMCQVMPFYAVGTFAAQIGATVGLSDDYRVGFALNVFIILGGIGGLLILDLPPRKLFFSLSFGISALALASFGFASQHNAITIATVCFAVYDLVLSAGMNLEQVYPPELFRTELRATGCELLAAIRRVGAASATFLLPFVMRT